MEKKDNVQHFLELIRRSQRGKFKIYIGMIAGVGKTYRMLQDAKEMLEHGTNVQIGYVETHGRADTKALLQGLSIIPRKKIFYKGKELEEMDIDAILQIHPEIVIVDELAHSNIEGSRNSKRWQDVMEMLDAGINVISAVNIQHIESLNDDIYNIVGIRVQERIPDNVLQEADEVVNIDLTSEELINRLKAGKIYRQEKVPIALSHFFKTENILQLRELALREVAFRVGKKVENEVTISNLRPTRQERVLVCVSSNAETQRSIIRKAARLTARCDGALYALYVQTPSEDTDRIPLTTQRHLMGHLELAAQLGGTIRQVTAKNRERAIIETCKAEHITTVCMGHPSFVMPKVWFKIGAYNKFLKTLGEMKIDLVIFA
ncbi:MAG: sensor protein KdpD [Prevotella sp.]|jgi:two-component system sensor histidine kinase KdpD